ncbi:MAG: hypothetical protein LBL65_08040 [Campylobacteraceae bacterium]|jgi:hypothetical protein|nr:hypothetical protein [Campylobacteraceae bacterium]
MQIPLLKPINIEYKKYFVPDFSDEDDFYDIAIIKYPHKILDVFDCVLDRLDPRIELLSNEYFRLSQEYRYLGFIEEVFDLNGKKCYVDAIFNENSHLTFRRELCCFDEIDKFILLRQLTTFSNIGHKKDYLIDDVNLAKMFIRGMLRESWQYSLYFDKNPLLVMGNYDLSLPLIFKNEKDIKIYEKIASKYGLYVR